MKKLIASVLFSTFAVTPAHAESKLAPNPVLGPAAWLIKIRAGTLQPYNGTDLDRDADGVTGCQSAIDKARSAGATALHEPTFKELGAKVGESRWPELSLGQAEGVCREAAFYKEVVLKDLKLFEDIALINYDHFVENNPSMVWLGEMTKVLERCEPAVDALLAAKVEPTLPFPVRSYVKTVADLKPNLCAKKRAELTKYFEHDKQAQQSARAPYVKAGIKGDKLEFMLTYDGSIYLPGGSSPEDIKKYVKASTMFIWTTSDPDAADYVVHTVRKHVFKGNTLVKTSEKTYRKPRGAKLGNGPFK